MKNLTIFALLASVFLSQIAVAEPFKISSQDITHGQFMSNKHEFAGFGCKGGNESPHLEWSGAPAGTKTFAVFAYDPDAPTGSGWWHWQVINIPNNTHELKSNSGQVNSDLLPKGSEQISNDYGQPAFGGACPPKGDGAHRYQFTVHALSIELELPENPSSALVGYMVNANSLASATIESLYTR